MLATTNAQAAMMTLAPGESTDDQPSNEHPRCEQWLFVLSGRGTAVVKAPKGRRRRLALLAGTLLVIERNELHQITNSGTTPLQTINLYVPPAYRSDGALRPAAKSSRVNRTPGNAP
jgi:mannose-6-phosphate isomerase-like protein (cupin superfamily)